MRDYLHARIGQRLGVVREGYPQEVTVRGAIARVEGDVVVVTTDEDTEIAIPVNRIVAVIPVDDAAESPVGFR